MKQEFELENSIGFLTNRAATELRYSLTRAFRAHGYDVTPEQFGVIVSLWRNDAQTQTELAANMAKDKTNVTRILDGLEKRKLVVRVTNENDRRSYRIRLTDEGRKLREKLTPIAYEINVKAAEALNMEEVEELKRYLKTIYDTLK